LAILNLRHLSDNKSRIRIDGIQKSGESGNDLAKAL